MISLINDIVNVLRTHRKSTIHIPVNVMLLCLKGNIFAEKSSFSLLDNTIIVLAEKSTFTISTNS